MHLSKFKLAVLALIAANIIWGAAPPIFKWALIDIGPFTLAFFRFLIASIIILPFSISHLGIQKDDIAEVFMIGFLGVTLNISFFFLGLKFAPSINSSIIASAGPIFLIFFSFLFLREKPKRKFLFGSGIGLFGVLVIMLEPLFSGKPDLDIVGNSFYFIATLAALGQTILGRKLLEKYEPLGITFWTFFVGAATFLPFFVYENLNKPAFSLTVNTISGILFGALLSSVVAYFLFYWALKYMSASETGIFTYIDPIITVLIAIPLVHEVPDKFYFFGAFLVFSGIYVAEGRIHYHPLHLLMRLNHSEKA